MSLRIAVRWTLPPVLLFAAVGWLARASGSAAEAMAGPGSIGATAPAAMGRAAPIPRATAADQLGAVEKFVAQKNEESGRQREEFVHAGWQIVDVPPPEPGLVSLDPSLLATREADLRRQIASTTPSPDQAGNLARIAREAADEETRVAAVEALGRISGDAGQEQLVELIHALPDGTLARRQIAPLLRPTSLSDARAASLAALLDDAALNAVERKQIAFSLSLVGLRDRSALPQGVLDGLSPDARALLASTTSLAQLSH